METQQSVKVTVTRPHSYVVDYLNGQQTYVEPFVIVNFSKVFVDEHLASFNSTLDGLIAAFSATGGASLVASLGVAAAIAAAVAAILKLVQTVGVNIAKLIFLNPDGTLSLYMAYHYIGTGSSSGVDPTAWPIPGIDPDSWSDNVNNLLRSTVRHSTLSIEKKDSVAGDLPLFSKTYPEFDFNVLSMKDATPKTTLSKDGFYSKFSVCMSAQGLPVPTGVFDSVSSSISVVTTLYSAVQTFGISVTIAELITAGALSEYLIAAGAFTASYYLGACIGCLISAGVDSALLPS
jgi:hypothetical protein